MAPRKRTTRQQKNDPRRAKLEAFLQDFDSAVKTKVVQLKENTHDLLKNVDNSYNAALIKLPKSVRQMVWVEQYNFGKSKSPEVGNAKKEVEAAIVDSVMAEKQALLLKSAKKTSKKNTGAKCSLEDENILSTTRKGRPKKNPPTTSKKAWALSVSKQNTSIRRSNRKLLTTPARDMLNSSLMIGSTPLVTPRFDPRLPMTPSVRVPRHKERVYSISVNGSPIAAGNEDIIINIPNGNGESMQLLASQMDSVDMSLLDETTVKSIHLLRNRLTSLCGIRE